MNITAALLELNLKQSDCPDAIHHAYRKLVRRWHPDQFAHQPEIHSRAEEKLKRINQAHSVLIEHFKNHNISSDINTDNTADGARCEKQNKPNPIGLGLLKVWLRDLFGTRTSNTGGIKQTRTRVNPDAPYPWKKRTRFEAILKTAYHARERQTFGACRRSMSSANPYRRRSTSTRIKGFRPASPASAVQPISGIDPIEGSD